MAFFIIIFIIEMSFHSDIINCEVENLWQTTDGRVLVRMHETMTKIMKSYT